MIALVFIQVGIIAALHRLCTDHRVAVPVPPTLGDRGVVCGAVD